MLSELHSKPVLVLGCGNPLVGDDGFGPAVAESLDRHADLPDHVSVQDMGTSMGDFLFDIILSPTKPACIFIVDAVSVQNRTPGELFELPLDCIPRIKACNFSLHQFPSVNLLAELHEDAGVKIRILAVHTRSLPNCVRPGLSPEIQAAVPHACSWLLDEIRSTF